MKQLNSIILTILMLLNITLYAQDLNSIWVNVDSIGIGNPGSLSTTNNSVTPIAFSDPCISEIQNFVLATEYQSGKVIVFGHEGVVADGNISSYDNLNYVSNAIDWLGSGSKRVLYKSHYITLSNTQILQTNLINDGYSIEGSISGDITPDSLQNTDILILGNDWNGKLPYTQSELSALEDFVANGGGLMVLGLGWSWPGELKDYPMNQVANIFDISYETSIIPDREFSDFDYYTTTPEVCYPKHVGTNYARGKTLRVLKLAVSVTGEATVANGGVASVKAKMDEWVKGINEVFGREYAIRLELVTSDALIYENSETDPWPDVLAGNGCQIVADLLKVQKENFDNIIGADNYDLSHVIAVLGGGCAGSFNSGVTGGFSVNVAQHEIGHQFGQSHMVNQTSSTNYEFEAGGGWTIHGGNQYPFAHGVTYHTTIENILNQNANKGINIDTGNEAPSVDAGPDYTIPISTPFTLTGNATDVNSEANLTYVWDNMNPWTMRRLPADDDTDGVLFSRFQPSTSNQRTFPRLSDVIANNNTGQYEQLPANPRFMDMRLTVNDNNQMNYQGEMINASGINSDDVRITVADAGPFVVTSQNTTGIVYTPGAKAQITWQVNGTNVAPINAINVKIALSQDGGYTYPTTLIESTQNDGQATVTIPNISTEQARIKVEAIGNIFFDINTVDFQITDDLGTCDWTFIANENEIMNFVGTKTIRYGGNGIYNTQTISGGTACSNNVFGDPTPGIEKTCEECLVTNLALRANSSASQSSNYSNTLGLAQLAIDGNTSGVWGQKSVTHTLNEERPWWQVRLGQEYPIGKIKIWNRTDSCCSSRLSNFDVFVYNDAGILVYKTTIVDTPITSVTIDAEGAIGSRVRVKLKDTNHLSLAEVEVYAHDGIETSYSTKIEAEDYDTMNGIVTNDTENENPQSLFVGWIDTGDWMDYTINIPSSGTYTINARVASARSNVDIQFQVNGTVLNTINMATTGGWQEWTTLSTNVNLSAGNQTLRIYSAGNNFNINWFEVTNDSSSAKQLDPTDTIINTFNMYPVPTKSELSILKTAEGEFALVEIVDLKGSILLKIDLKEKLTTLDLSSFKSGIYIARFYNSNGSNVIKKIIKE